MASDADFDPRVPLLLMLSATTGLVDAASVLGLGKVFTANMTGNIVFLGFAAAGVPGFEPLPFIVAIATFMLGATIAGRVGRAHHGGSERRWLVQAATFEAVSLWLAAGIAAFPPAVNGSEPRLLGVIALTGIAMGFRNATIRQLKVPDLTTTVLTLTLTGLGADSRAAGGASPNRRRRVAAVVAIFAGAAAGAWLYQRVGLVAPLALAGALVLGSTLLCLRHSEPA